MSEILKDPGLSRASEARRSCTAAGQSVAAGKAVAVVMDDDDASNPLNKLIYGQSATQGDVMNNRHICEIFEINFVNIAPPI
jgi:hypothetical protein